MAFLITAGWLNLMTFPIANKVIAQHPEVQERWKVFLNHCQIPYNCDRWKMAIFCPRGKSMFQYHFQQKAKLVIKLSLKYHKMIIPDICQNRHTRRWCIFSSQCPFCTENAKFCPFWPIFAILLQIYAFIGVLLQG